jgi:hypothetical protein
MGEHIMNKANITGNMENLIIVDLSQYDHGFIATTEHPALPGLFVSAADYHELVKKIPVAIRVLMRAIFEKEFIVEPAAQEERRANDADFVRPIATKIPYKSRIAA